MNIALLQDLSKNAFPGHDAVPDSLVDGAVAVAFFSDLRHAKRHGSGPEDRSHREACKINALHQQVLSKIAVRHLSALLIEFLYLVVGKQAHLTMPFPGMRVMFDPEILDKTPVFHGPFFSSFRGGNTYSSDCSLHNSIHLLFSFMNVPLFPPLF